MMKRGGVHNRSGGVQKRLFVKFSIAIIILVICTVSLLTSTKTYNAALTPSKVPQLPMLSCHSLYFSSFC